MEWNENAIQGRMELWVCLSGSSAMRRITEPLAGLSRTLENLEAPQAVQQAGILPCFLSTRTFPTQKY
jgi:hypothetical protein